MRSFYCLCVLPLHFVTNQHAEVRQIECTVVLQLPPVATVAAVQQSSRSLALSVFNSQYLGCQWSACTHTSQDGQKHTMNFNNLYTIEKITAHSTFVKFFGIRDLYWENHSKTVEKIAFCLFGTTTCYFLLFFLNSMHSQISHRYIYSLTLLCYWNSLQIKTLLKWWPQGCAKGKTSNVSPAICLS